MAAKKETGLNRLMGTLRNQFLIGLAVSVPLVVTILVLSWLFNTIDNILQPVIRIIFGQSLPGAGLVATVVLIYLAGLISSNVVGREIIHLGERVVYRVPLVRTVYSSVKQVVESFSSNGKSNFLQVVLVEYPRKGVMSLAFVTSQMHDKEGRKLLTLLIATAPNPLSGYVIVVPEEEVVRTDLKVDAAMRMLISCGAILPPETHSGKPFTNWPPEITAEETKTAREERERQELEALRNSDH